MPVFHKLSVNLDSFAPIARSVNSKSSFKSRPVKNFVPEKWGSYVAPEDLESSAFAGHRIVNAYDGLGTGTGPRRDERSDWETTDGRQLKEYRSELPRFD